jgi:MFS family permease
LFCRCFFSSSSISSCFLSSPSLHPLLQLHLLPPPDIRLIYNLSIFGDISTAFDNSTAATRSEEISFAAWKSVVILTGTTLLILFLHTSLSPAIPVIADDFGVDESLAAWVMSVYMISGAVMTIVIGRFSDIFGAKKMLVLMMIIYTAATALAGFSQNIETLLTIRAIQGIAIANTPIALKIIRDQFPKGKFSIGQSITTSAYSGGMALGVVLGPILVASVGWQSIFFICTPIAAILLFACWRALPVDETTKIMEHIPAAAAAGGGVTGARGGAAAGAATAGADEEEEKELRKGAGDESEDKEKEKNMAMMKKEKKKRKKIDIDIKGIITMTIALVSFLVAITNSGSLLEKPVEFGVPLVIGAISLVIFVRVEKKSKDPLVPLKLLFQPAIFAGNVAMLMFGIVQYIIITAIPQLGAAPSGSGLGLTPEMVGLLQLPLSLAVLVFGPVFGLLLAKKHKLNTKLLIPGMVIMSVSFLLVTLFHSTSSNVTASLFIFGIGAALLPVTLINIIIALTPRELTGISSASTSDMRIIGGAIGPVIATVILSSILVPIEVNGTTSEYPSPTAFNIVFIVGLALSIAATILVMFMRRPAVKALNSTQVR